MKHVGMMAGGTGITPMLQVVQAALRDSNDSCNFYMRLGGFFAAMIDDLRGISCINRMNYLIFQKTPTKEK